MTETWLVARAPTSNTAIQVGHGLVVWVDRRYDSHLTRSKGAREQMDHVNPMTFVRDALEASIYASPREYGLTLAELVEVGRAHGFKEGEIRDALRGRFQQERGRFTNESDIRLMATLTDEPGDPRSIDAIQLVFTEFEELAKEFGQARARIERDTLIQRGVDAGLSRSDMEIAVAVCIVGTMVKQGDHGVLEAVNILKWASPKTMRAQETLTRRPTDAVVYLETVREVVGRRSEGAIKFREPLDAFEPELDDLGFAEIRTWWAQTRAELRRASPVQSPTTVVVLAAALCEAALATCALAAQKRADPDALNGDAKSWRFHDLTKWARKSSVGIITDERLNNRCTDLNEHRQRVHAGRFLDRPEMAKLVDLKPEQARAARETLDLLLRAILDARHRS